MNNLTHSFVLVLLSHLKPIPTHTWILNSTLLDCKFHYPQHYKVVCSKVIIFVLQYYYYIIEVLFGVRNPILYSWTARIGTGTVTGTGLQILQD